VSGDELLGRLLLEFGCVADGSYGDIVVVVCGDCRTTVTLNQAVVYPGELRNIERDLRPCLGDGADFR